MIYKPCVLLMAGKTRCVKKREEKEVKDLKIARGCFVG